MADQANQLEFLDHGGRIGRRIAKLDWSKHPLGAIATWDAALRGSLAIVLGSPLPTFLVWGPDLTLFFNDAYEPMLGQKAHSLGSPYPAVWNEVWDCLGPCIGRVLAGESLVFENHAVALGRPGYPEQAWFTFSYSPLRDDAGAVRGLICTCIERTAEALALAPPDNAGQCATRLPATAGANEQCIRQSSEAIARQVRHMTALVDIELARGSPSGRPAAPPAAPLISSAPAPIDLQRLALNDP